MSSSFQRWAYWATGVELELAHGHEASNQDLNWHLGLKPSCFDHYTKSSKASSATEGHQLEQLSWHFIMFNSPTLRPFISPMYVCVCFDHVYTGFFLYPPSSTPSLELHSWASLRLQMSLCKTPNPYYFHQITMDGGQNIRGKIRVSSLHSPTSQGHYEQNKWVLEVWRI